MPNKTIATATLLLAPLLALALVPIDAHAQKRGAQPKTKKLYCWEQNGAKVCGDALPAEAAGARRSEFSTTGAHTGEIARAMTPEERAAAEAAAKAEREHAESEKMRFLREMAMAESYATEEDLRKSFHERIALLDESLKASELGVVGLRQSLVALLRQAGENELAGKPVTPVARANIAKQHAELRRRERLFATQRVQRASLDEELESVLTRYREIKQGQRAPESAAATPAQPPATGG
ncbi:hypothetical protein LF41_2085 [Lysobacter dokdonensis DS-58]|uniref:Secreted protein n=1 Tax=Lysobacter dokdonensis DS-58 TaxID=1300345 RepID=A0A0A2WIV8_9GAMM|nr:hypothetical protein [Lysobacter dokdonensis]KGQ20131.1 hypothetical protein LF41_2085 [Lysobacter dokdonensis DS-58]